MQFLLPIALLGALLHVHSATAQEYSANRWRETSRLNTDKQEVHFTDTVWLNTTDRQMIDVVIGGYAYRGTVAGDSLDIKKRTFYVEKNEPEEIRLQFGKLTHIFTRALKDMTGADVEVFASENSIPAGPVTKINAKQLPGVWRLYKKTLREGATAELSKIQYPKKLHIYSKPLKGIRGTLLTVNNLEYKIKEFKGSEIRVLTTLNQPQSFKVLKQSPAELLLEDEHNAIYFFKKY
ncbi:hypothetical protein [Taibaiella koreensis]|uniref:hypothetical protein n=1 Tax=Taibaiella koreensis TaxID=1268548 RepID=UPI000E59CC39|nr:hypothetical protein [Taibaiella koreensis]